VEREIHILKIEPSPGPAGLGPDRTVMVRVVIRTVELGRLEFSVHVPDKGSDQANAEEARAALTRFARKLTDGLKHPLAMKP
jgi:hypothetical protein